MSETVMAGGMIIASGGWGSNLIVYLMEGYNMKSVDAAQFSNIIMSFSSLLPVLGAIIADSFAGCFSVVWISSSISLLGILFLLSTSSLDFLRPQPCKIGPTICTNPSRFQYGILYIAIALASIGGGCMGTTVATMGANQFLRSEDQRSFFNWHFFVMYCASIMATTIVVYVQDNVSWVWGFGICATVNALALVVFLSGRHLYCHVKPKGSPFTSFPRIVIAAIWKRKVPLSPKAEDYYHGPGEDIMETPTTSFRFLNRAAWRTEREVTQLDYSTTKSWKLCTVQQVEDLKKLIKIFPLWSTSILVTTPIGIHTSMVVLQALTMDRNLGPHFKISAGSMIVFTFISTAVSLAILDRCLWPAWRKLTGQSPTPLQRVGIGHVLIILSMAVSATVESNRLEVAQSHRLRDSPSSVAPMSVLWLVPQLAIVGVGEAFHMPGLVSFYYQEFPMSLKSVSSAITSVNIGVGIYLSTIVVDLIRMSTGWLAGNINDGRLDNVYWVCFVMGVLNFVYYLLCAWFYKYKNIEIEVDNNNINYE